MVFFFFWSSLLLLLLLCLVWWKAYRKNVPQSVRILYIIFIHVNMHLTVWRFVERHFFLYQPEHVSGFNIRWDRVSSIYKHTNIHDSMLPHSTLIVYTWSWATLLLSLFVCHAAIPKSTSIRHDFINHNWSVFTIADLCISAYCMLRTWALVLISNTAMQFSA